MKHLTLIGLAALLTACGGGDDSNDDSSQPAKMSLAFSDAPVDAVSKVCIAVSNISIHPVTGAEQSWTTASFLTSAQDDGCTPIGESIPLDGSGHPLFTYIDLLSYQGSASRPLLASQSVVPGEYSQMRLQILDGTKPENQFADGTPYSYVLQDDGITIKPLEVPSNELKLDAFTIAANGLSAFTTEFDLRHAMVLPGHEKNYKLKPRGVRLVNITEVATVSGTVAAGLCTDVQLNEGQAFVYFYDIPHPNDDDYPDMADPQIDPTAKPGFYASAPVAPLPGGGYSYELGFVNLGSYDMTLVCNGDEDDPELAGDPLQEARVLKAQSVVAPTTNINFQ